MLETKPTTRWAVASLVCGILGWLAVLTLFVFAERYAEMAKASAGVGIIWYGGHELLAAVFCLLGVACGLVALVRIRRGPYGGRGMAWAGIVLGCLPFAFAALAFFTSDADSNPFR